ncbi:LamG-like jellyroll fold domain-containing protein [Nocardioides sp. NPDC047086]|uniref:LamG-like jellyroll fold domain-containing protein n=1 Tax=Nocardioides sp. NPDC047086 TaxID=3154810 RepID=UPI0033E87416
MLGIEHATTRHTSEGDYTTRTGKVDDAYRPLTTTLEYPQAATGDDTGEGAGLVGDIPEALARLSTESASVDYTYTADGQIKSQTTSKISSTDSATILGSERVTTFYDQASKPRWMGGGFGWGTYVADSHYDDLGRLELADLGNTYSAALSRTYDPTTGQLTGQMLKREGITGNDLNQTYKYTDSGNITEITDTPTNTALGGDAGVGARGEKQCFTYDNLARLKHAWTPALGSECGTGDPGNPALAGPAPYQVGYTYNPLNSNREAQTYRDGLTGITETTDYDYTQAGHAGPHAVTSITGTSKAADGTTTPLPSKDFTYTATGGQETRTGAEVAEVAVPEPDVLDVDYTDGTPADDAQGRTMTKYGTPAVIDDTTLDAARRAKLGLAGSKVAKFDGVDDAYSYAMGDAQWDKLSDEMSIECLMKDNGTLPNSTEHSVCSAKEGGGASMVVYDGKLTFTIHTDGGYRQAQATITAGKWYHAFGTWDGDTARLYLDGQLAASVEAPGPMKRPGNLGRNGFFVGADASSTTAGQFFSPVSVAKMGLYSQALSATEIAAIHNGARTAEGAAARRSVAQAMCWDREGKLVKTLTTGETCSDGVVDELGEAEYVYSGAGERIIRADAEAVTIYLPGGQEVTIPRDSTRNVAAHRYYTFNGETIAVRDQRGLGGVTSLVNDHHGTPIVSIPNTNWTPASVRKQYADPFGATRGRNAAAAASVVDRDANGAPGDRGFLGKSNDTTGLTQVGARYYDSTTGSFVSPDPVLDQAVPLQLNGYAYSYQNPATLSDPSGLHTDYGGAGGGSSTSTRSKSSVGGFLSGLWSKVTSTVKRKASVDASWMGSRGAGQQFRKEFVSGAVHAAASTIDFAFNGIAKRNGSSVRVNTAKAWNRFSDSKLGTHSGGLAYLAGDLATMAVPVGGASSGATRGAAWLARSTARSRPAVAKSAGQYADEMAAAGKETGAVARLDLADGGAPIYGESGSARVFHPDMQEALDSLPRGVRKMRISGWCAEIACINDALYAGRSLSGGVIDTRAVGTTPPGHGRTKEPCPTCARILPRFGVEVAE